MSNPANDQTDTAPAPLPVWLSIPIILVCLGGGGWIIHWYVMTDPISHESKILGDAPAQAQWQQRPRNRNNNVVRARSIQQGGNGYWFAATEKARMVVSVDGAKGTLRNIFYLNAGFLPGEAHQTLLAARALYQDQKRTEAMKLNPQQLNRIRNLSSNLQMAITPSDKEQLASAVAAYVTDTNTRPTAEEKALTLLDEVADRSMDATRQAAVDHAARINQIITPEMWKLDQQGTAGK